MYSKPGRSARPPFMNTVYSVEDFALERLKMAEILIKIKIEGNSNALAFVERTQPYLSKGVTKQSNEVTSNE